MRCCVVWYSANVSKQHSISVFSSTYILPAHFSETSLQLHHTSRNYTRYDNILQFNPIQIPSDYFCRTHFHVVFPSGSEFLL